MLPKTVVRSKSCSLKEWSADYEGHKITVTLQAYRSFVAKLYIDEELRDDNRLEASKVRARGEICSAP